MPVLVHANVLRDKWGRFLAADGEQKIRYLLRLATSVLSKAIGAFRYAARFVLKPVGFVLYAALFILSLGRPVRIGMLSAKGRISLMIMYLEPCLRKLQLDRVRDPLVIMINPGRCPNEQLSRMYGRVVWLIDDKRPALRTVFSAIYHLLRFVGCPATVTWTSPHATLGYAREWQQGNPILRFTREELERGERLLGDIGIPHGSPYICFGLREAAYYEQFLTSEAHAHARHLNTEAREDTYVRNPPLANYIPMANDCAGLGLYVLRMGQVVSEPLPSGIQPRIIDYAGRHRTPFGDVYLLAHCKFVIAGGAGLWLVSTAFNRPAVMTDSYALWGGWFRHGDLFIPKKLWLIAEKRVLTFREMLKADMRYSYKSNCHQDGIELVHNSAEEISAVVREINQRVDGTWKVSAGDEELQRRFKSLYPPDHRGYGMPGRIGAEFLRQHSDLL